MAFKWLINLLLLFVYLNCWNIAAANAESEEVIYNAQNTIDSTINAVEIIRTDTGEQLFYRSVDVSPINRNTWGISSFWGIGAFAPDSGDPVPEEVKVSWRKLPRAGQALYRGDVEGPYTVKVRSRIPLDVLKKSREPGYDLALMFLVGKSPVSFCWRLGDYKSKPPANIKLQHGGYCVHDPYFQNKKTSVSFKKQEKNMATQLPKRENWSVAENNRGDISDLNIIIPGSKNGYFSPTIPDELEISWRTINAIEDTEKGQLVGPHRVKVRSIIDKEALKLINNNYYHIVISINTTKKTPTLCWKLWNIKEQPKGKLIMQGGDC